MSSEFPSIAEAIRSILGARPHIGLGLDGVFRDPPRDYFLVGRWNWTVVISFSGQKVEIPGLMQNEAGLLVAEYRARGFEAWKAWSGNRPYERVASGKQ